MTTLSPEATRILLQLPPDGSTIGNIRLRALLHMGRVRYDTAKEELLAGGRVTRGIGRGGTLARTAPLSADELKAEQGVERESDLYSGFAKWLREEQFAPDGDTPFSHVAVTATPRGHQRSSGPWSRPDITAVQVLDYDFLPGKTLEVSTFELKRAADAPNVRSVYEAAAHGRWAHFTNLVVEVVDAVPVDYDRLVTECTRLHVGLYEVRAGKPKLIRDAERLNPDAREIDQRL